MSRVTSMPGNTLPSKERGPSMGTMIEKISSFPTINVSNFDDSEYYERCRTKFCLVCCHFIMSFYSLYPRWEFRFISCNTLWGNPITSQLPPFSGRFSSYFSPLCNQSWHALPGFLPAPSWSTHLLQDLPYQSFKTAVPDVPKPS